MTAKHLNRAELADRSGTFPANLGEPAYHLLEALPPQDQQL